ncbi:hypothetical protein [Parapedobacter indicus]|uniref:Uncharacterized protein n=1 Tax=Parapedobacter indicus TaxID=1477437 RepID=A0A1I3E422_9SPHI|nr:hypothetical protein [Parapedobacter indicus]PPL04960.1 hypothetical protein CLV26_101771 [Parapedobacter indicus]SFH93734.1 hypothetical protein SAMN05444682_101757 [Parapedobacter indicus]
MKKYNQPPIQLKGHYPIEVEEMMYYQYLPIKMAGSLEFRIPARLAIFEPIIDAVKLDFYRHSGKLYGLCENYIYLTAKHMFVAPGTNLNRLGWHSDGFGSDDISYIWCNTLPTVWTDGRPDPPNDDAEALKYFNAANDLSVYETEPFKIYRLDQYVVHACAVSDRPVLRSFVKVNISKDQYNLVGNSHNYLLDYDWEMKERNVERNHPMK